MHQTMIDGTTYEIDHGNALVDSTQFVIDHGNTLVDGTGYIIPFVEEPEFEWVGAENATLLDYNDLCVAKQQGKITKWPDDIPLGTSTTYETPSGETRECKVQTKGTNFIIFQSVLPTNKKYTSSRYSVDTYGGEGLSPLAPTVNLGATLDDIDMSLLYQQCVVPSTLTLGYFKGDDLIQDTDTQPRIVYPPATYGTASPACSVLHIDYQNVTEDIKARSYYSYSLEDYLVSSHLATYTYGSSSDGVYYWWRRYLQVTDEEKKLYSGSGWDFPYYPLFVVGAPQFDRSKIIHLVADPEPKYVSGQTISPNGLGRWLRLSWLNGASWDDVDKIYIRIVATAYAWQNGRYGGAGTSAYAGATVSSWVSPNTNDGRQIGFYDATYTKYSSTLTGAIATACNAYGDSTSKSTNISLVKDSDGDLGLSPASSSNAVAIAEVFIILK